jgi:hypothetical protein
LSSKNVVPASAKGEKFHVSIKLDGVGSVNSTVGMDDANWQIREMFKTLIEMKDE